MVIAVAVTAMLGYGWNWKYLCCVDVVCSVLLEAL